MLKNDLVSLIVPFYNSEDYIERLLQSVLKQSYKKIQFILVNDGSTDRSEEIVLEYKKKLDNYLYEFIYLTQKNGGAASAVNNALKYVDGEFLTWADSDDELNVKNIEKKHLFLQKNNEYGYVMSKAIEINQETGKINGVLEISEKKKKDNMFLEIIDGIPVYAGVFMIRTELLFNRLHNRNIYFNREVGQNYQLLLPVAYDNKCGFIDEILYTCYMRKTSHSHNVTYEKAYDRIYQRELLLDNVLEFMPKEEKKVLIESIENKSNHKRFELSFAHNDLVNNNLSYSKLKKQNITSKEKIKHMIINHVFLNKLYRKIK